jgi:hypothetical protein
MRGYAAFNVPLPERFEAFGALARIAGPYLLDAARRPPRNAQTTIRHDLRHHEAAASGCSYATTRWTSMAQGDRRSAELHGQSHRSVPVGITVEA